MTGIIEESFRVQELHHPLFTGQDLRLHMARLDEIHPVLSGNKLFKLIHYLEKAMSSGKAIRSYGGAYSNHLVATAFACHHLGIDCTGVVRGEKPVSLSPSLFSCLEYGMKLEFISREDYRRISTLQSSGNAEINIPEGGYSFDGARGATGIVKYLLPHKPTHIALACGTATTGAGIAMATDATIILVPALKNLQDIHERFVFLTGKTPSENILCWNTYHFGGYARYNKTLMEFMNRFYTNFKIGLDFVYTAKMMYAVMDKIEAGFFQPGSNIICLHTGGMQGNRSLPGGILTF